MKLLFAYGVGICNLTVFGIVNLRDGFYAYREEGSVLCLDDFSYMNMAVI